MEKRSSQARYRVSYKNCLRVPIACLAAAAGLGHFVAAFAVDVAPARESCEEPILQAYEPTTLGYTWQANDEPFVDFTVSFKAPLFQKITCRHFGGNQHLYLGFTGHFAFYVATRRSGPVIGREYNPKLLWRWTDPRQTTTSIAYGDRVVTEYGRYIDVAYAHSSNGQTIDSLEEYEIQSYQSKSSRDALDYVSRGWDYVQIAGKLTDLDVWRHGGDFSVYPDVKFFLRHGLLQGVPEEYNSWERDSALRPRHAFDGLAATFEYRPFAKRVRSRDAVTTWDSLRLSLKYLTGYEPVARYNTIRAEFGISVLGLPVSVWAQDGYMNSLARYYTKTSAVGVELRFAEF
jgi:outer membrane phospholipase A